MKTLFLNCVLFTLADQEVAENKYIPIFCTWLSKLIQNGGLGRDDFLLISIDERTIQHLKTNAGILGTLLSYLKCPYAFKIFPAPATLLDGMKIRYTAHDFKQDAYMYLDIDILVMKPLRLIVDQTENAKLYICTEGTLRDPNYGADMSSTDDPGYTSAVFMVTAPWVMEVLCRRVGELYEDKGYYTLDQPFYNRAVYMMPRDSRITKYVSYNGHNYSKDDTVLLNCGGEPGRDKIHYDKIHEILCLINVGFF
jgi:hypothetical protein